MAPAPALAGGAEDVAGVWLTAAGDAKVRVSPCGASLCGVIVWLKKPIDPSTGKPQVDDKNANKALASRPIIGLNIFQTMRAAGAKWSGRIYNADDGKTYASELHLSSARKLEVRGCVLGILCGGETWTKVGEVSVASATP
jgi:uncharacterized protein (DUF2147 family)